MATLVARYSSLRLLDRFRVPGDLNLKLNDMVVLRTKRGVEMGQVKVPAGDEKLKPKESIVGEVLRRTSLEDSESYRNFRMADYKPIKKLLNALAREHDLPMRFAAAERLLSGDKMIVYFTSEERVDFREIVRELQTELDARVELRQVGARDAARLTGDVGSCGRELCCVSFIVDFVPVSMKMAKTQRISLDPGKISGMCGRLKCCLKYEDELYNKLKITVPLEGQPCNCDGNECHACNVDILGQKVTLDFGEGAREVRDVSEISFEPGWSEKDVRRYKRERHARFMAEKLEREQEREQRRSARVTAALARQTGQMQPKAEVSEPTGTQAPATEAEPTGAVEEPQTAATEGDSGDRARPPRPPGTPPKRRRTGRGRTEGGQTSDTAGTSAPTGEANPAKRRRKRRRRRKPGGGEGGPPAPKPTDG